MANDNSTSILNRASNRCLRILAELAYGLTTRWFSLLMAAAVIAVLLYHQFWPVTQIEDINQRWNNVWSPIIGIATLVVALAVWWSELLEEWRDSLLWKLSVAFEHDFGPSKGIRNVMVVRYADLAGLQDARNLAQQIGSQVAGVQHLKFNPATIRPVFRGIEREKGSGHFRHVSLRFTLTGMPTREIKDGATVRHVSTVEESVASGDAYLLWQPPFQGPPIVVAHPPAST
jgi:hypothetical protein